MLYSLLAAVLILSFLMPIMCYISFVKGYNIDREKPITLPKPRKKRREKKEQERMEKLFSNIDNYDGTPIGQEEIK